MELSQLHRVLFPRDSRFRIFEVLERSINVAFQQQSMGETPRISDFESHLTWKFAREAGVEHIRIRRLEVRSDPHKLARNGCDVRRRHWKRLGRRRRQRGWAAVVARTCAEAIGGREIFGTGEANRPILVILRDQIAAKAVIYHCCPDPERTLSPKDLPHQS